MPAKAEKRVTKFVTEVIVEDENHSSMVPRILATVPVPNHRDATPVRKGVDPLRETLPWPLPENCMAELKNLSVRETVAWTK